jgi:hypothetical protein
MPGDTHTLLWIRLKKPDVRIDSQQIAFTPQHKGDFLFLQIWREVKRGLDSQWVEDVLLSTKESLKISPPD